ncbi:MAG: precorrin-2 C(20)-methyltransferase [Desulfarculaceae bacterium]|nr:precorrin-2 C(20)-methyltransferase [Desulfarculaceae bacterium]
MKEKKGTLYGIGVGPGDPDLIPMKSVSILESVDVVFGASSTKNRFSLAARIAGKYIPEETEMIMVQFPMTKDEDAKIRAWDENARQIIDVLEQGKDAAFLTLGDTLTYSTFGYIVRAVQKLAPDVSIVTIPGITSYQAAAARTNTPLMEGEESLLILSGVNGGAHLRERLTTTENVVFLKAYKHAQDIVAAVDEAGMRENSFGISKCCRADEEIIEDIREFNYRDPGYWTLIVAKKKGPDGA